MPIAILHFRHPSDICFSPASDRIIHAARPQRAAVSFKLNLQHA